jgi:uncharacterized membrane protein
MEWLSVVSPIVNRVLDFIPNPAEKAKAEAQIRAELMAAAVKESENQAEINKVEAASSSVFVAGWRPAIGWVCAFAFAWQFAVAPVAAWIMILVGVTIPMPNIDNNNLMNLTMGMLGLGAFRSFEKWKGVSK